MVRRTPRGSRGGGEAVASGAVKAIQKTAGFGGASTTAHVAGGSVASAEVVSASSCVCFMTTWSGQSSHAGLKSEHVPAEMSSQSGIAQAGVTAPRSAMATSAIAMSFVVSSQRAMLFRSDRTSYGLTGSNGRARCLRLRRTQGVSRYAPNPSHSGVER